VCAQTLYICVYDYNRISFLLDSIVFDIGQYLKKTHLLERKTNFLAHLYLILYFS